MIVYKNKGACVQLESSAHNFPWVDRHMVDGAAAKFLIGNQHIFTVQEKTAEHFSITV